MKSYKWLISNAFRILSITWTFSLPLLSPPSIILIDLRTSLSYRPWFKNWIQISCDPRFYENRNRIANDNNARYKRAIHCQKVRSVLSSLCHKSRLLLGFLTTSITQTHKIHQSHNYFRFAATATLQPRRRTSGTPGPIIIRRACRGKVPRRQNHVEGLLAGQLNILVRRRTDR